MGTEKDFVRYELQGRSLEAAKALECLMTAEWRSKSGGKWEDKNENARKKFEADMPAEAAMLGHFAPAIQVGKCGGNLRAYRTFPLVFHPRGQKFYLDVPVDYQGSHFTPPDGKLLNGPELKASEKGFYAGMGENIMPVLSMDIAGVAPPADKPKHLSEIFAVSSRHYGFESFSDRDRVYFLPDAKTMAAAKVFENKAADYKRAVDALTQAVEAIVVSLHPKIAERLEKPAKISQHVFYYEGKVAVSLRAGFEDTRIFLPDHPAFTIKDSKDRSRVIPRADTPEGRKLLDLFNAIPKQAPKPDDEPPLHGLKSARFKKVAGLDVLSVDKADAAKVSTLVPMAADRKAWLDKDQEDKEMRIALPPKPAGF